MWILYTIPLKSPKVISVTEFQPDFLKDFKISLLSFMPDCLIEVPPEVSGYPIVIEQGVVNVKEEYDFMLCHITNSLTEGRALASLVVFSPEKKLPKSIRSQYPL
jgi:hypothetical protein